MFKSHKNPPLKFTRKVVSATDRMFFFFFDGNISNVSEFERITEKKKQKGASAGAVRPST